MLDTTLGETTPKTKEEIAAMGKRPHAMAKYAVDDKDRLESATKDNPVSSLSANSEYWRERKIVADQERTFGEKEAA
jgi:hypothetical protein